MTAYDPKNQRKAVELIESENRVCSCGRALHVQGVKALSEEQAEVSCHCGRAGHNEYNYRVAMAEIQGKKRDE